jgi:hypothetical protein
LAGHPRAPSFDRIACRFYPYHITRLSHRALIIAQTLPFFHPIHREDAKERSVTKVGGITRVGKGNGVYITEQVALGGGAAVGGRGTGVWKWDKGR